MSARLALGAAAFLAGLSAASWNGSRSEGNFYHVTTREAADDILRNGFYPGWGDIGFGVYFYGTLRSAESYARAGGWDGGLKGEEIVILGVRDARIRKIEEWELDPSWDPSKYSDMYVLGVDEGDGDEDLHVPVREVDVVWSSR